MYRAEKPTHSENSETLSQNRKREERGERQQNVLLLKADCRPSGTQNWLHVAVGENVLTRIRIK